MAMGHQAIQELLNDLEENVTELDALKREVAKKKRLLLRTDKIATIQECRAFIDENEPKIGPLQTCVDQIRLRLKDSWSDDPILQPKAARPDDDEVF